MSYPLRSVVYVSTASSLMGDAELEDLLTPARAQNLLTHITGLLLYADGNFMQCFEGPEPAAAETYARIKASRRHKDLIELMNQPVAERSFPDWQMALAQPTRSAWLALSTAQWQRSQLHVEGDTVPPPAGLLLLRRFWADAQR